MLLKTPKNSFRKWFKRGVITIFCIETAAFVISYNIWLKVNTDRESRKYLRDNFPFLLEVYYRTGEYIDSSSKIRQIDTAHWSTICSGTGYGLFVATTPSEEKLNKFKKEFSGAKQSPGDIQSKNQQFFDTLQSAASSDKPIYLMSKKELENLRNK
ncbi:hypothetical protein WA026_012502 [Henosepilachna vigintioctopunctata]|uniref:Uncharacterized protein n=1 Tax=Henosepilachna vigintioctopunctata TaxID=420089 RepID=A0AAW1UXD6_9CUCU